MIMRNCALTTKEPLMIALALVATVLRAAPLFAQQQPLDPLPAILSSMSSLPGTIPTY
jgi:hypothetical protein